jgi:malate dehydrogenase (oxaloacetate-decarboxylating)
MSDTLREAALDYHRYPTPGKISVNPTKPMATQRDLALAYSPGVADACMEIVRDPAEAMNLTSRANLVAVITNGTAVLGLGNIGALAGLPVMEGKAALFSTLAGINAVPILLDETDPAPCVEHVAAIAGGFGAIQLEDIAAPACFAIEEGLRARLDKPVLHDDQHGTAVVTLAAVLNATRRTGRALGECIVGQVGLGAAGIGIVRLLQCAGARRVLGTDLDAGALARLSAMGGEAATLGQIMEKADIVVATTGARGLIEPESVRAGQIILALSNPDPEIEPAVALARGAAIAADGKGINNLLGFPGLFKGALEARAKRFTDAMLLAAAGAIAELAKGDDLVPDPLDRAVHEAVAAAVRRSSQSGAS